MLLMDAVEEGGRAHGSLEFHRNGIYRENDRKRKRGKGGDWWGSNDYKGLFWVYFLKTLRFVTLQVSYLTENYYVCN